MCMGANTAKFYLGVNKGLSSKMGSTHFEKNKSLPNGSFLRWRRLQDLHYTIVRVCGRRCCDYEMVLRP